MRDMNDLNHSLLKNTVFIETLFFNIEEVSEIQDGKHQIKYRVNYSETSNRYFTKS